MATYKKGNEIYDGKSIVIGDRRYLSPSEAILLQAGYTKVEPQEPTEEEVAARERAQRIEELRELISACDWKITKTAEYRLVGLPDPYNTAALHAERQALRDEINELESEE